MADLEVWQWLAIGCAGFIGGFLGTRSFWVVLMFLFLLYANDRNTDKIYEELKHDYQRQMEVYRESGCTEQNDGVEYTVAEF